MLNKISFTFVSVLFFISMLKTYWKPLVVIASTSLDNVYPQFLFYDIPAHWDVKFNTLRPRQNGRHFPDDIFKWIFLNENVWISIKISLEFVPRGLINNIPALVQIMAWRRPADKPLSEPMMVSLPTHICVTRPQWVKSITEGNAVRHNGSVHYSDVIMSSMASQTTGVSIVCSTVCSDQRKQQSSPLLAFVMTGGFPPQRACNAENVSIWWHHHVMCYSHMIVQTAP